MSCSKNFDLCHKFMKNFKMKFFTLLTYIILYKNCEINRHIAYKNKKVLN